MNKLRITFTFLLLLSFSNSGFAVSASVPQAAITVDLLIVGGTLVTMDKDRRIIENGAIGITNGKIEIIGTRANVTPNVRAKRTINAAGKVIIPGLINAHTHVPMTLFRGISDDLDLNDWLTKYIFPAAAKNVDEQFVRAGTRLGLAGVIRGGTTAGCDMEDYEGAIADESKKAGGGGVLGRNIIDLPVADNKTHEEARAYTEGFLKKWTGDELIVPALAPHAP